MPSWLGPEFREGAEDPPFWEYEDPDEELLPWHQPQSQPVIQSLIDPRKPAVYQAPNEELPPWYHAHPPGIESLVDPDTAVFADDSLTVDPASLDQTQFSAPSPEA